jgi:hypothetical protein
MDLSALRDEVGPERFDAACDWAWRTAPDHVHPRLDWPDDLGWVPHDLDSLIWDAQLPAAQRLPTALALYRRMPCYWNAVTPYNHLRDLSAAELDAYWAEARALLDGEDDALADPLAYTLWCEWFENQETCADAWERLTDVEAPPRRLHRVLAVSGPVPHALKRDLLWWFTGEGPDGHRAVAEALVHGAFDYYGRLDVPDATALLRVLEGVDDVRGIDELRDRVARPWWLRLGWWQSRG